MGSRAYEQQLDNELQSLDNTYIRVGDVPNGNYTRFNMDGTQEIFVNGVSQGVTVGSDSIPQKLEQTIVAGADNSGYNDTRLLLVNFDAKMTLKKVLIEVNTKINGAFYEIALLDTSGNVLSSTNGIEVQAAGKQWVAIPEYEVFGQYYIAFSCDTNTALFVSDDSIVCKSDTFTFPIADSTPIDISATSTASGFPNMVLLAEGTITIGDVDFENDDQYRVVGANGSQPWAWNTTTGKMAFSANNGDSYTDLMSVPTSGPKDLIIYKSKAYVIGNDDNIYVSTDLTSGATWTTTKPAGWDTNATTRPYGFALYNDNIFLGEYTSGVDTARGFPKLWKADVATLTWTESLTFTNGRHVHSLNTNSDGGALWMSVGDLGYGSDVGMWRLTSGGINPGIEDSWTKWQGITDVETYPVDHIEIASGTNALTKAGVYGASDVVDAHVLYMQTSGAAGSFIMSRMTFKDNDASAGETVRSIIKDGNNNLYYWTAESDTPAIYMTPPPYTDHIKLHDYNGVSQILTRAVLSGNYILMRTNRFKVQNPVYFVKQ